MSNHSHVQGLTFTAFYEKCGFFHKECEMALYMDQPSTTTLASRL